MHFLVVILNTVLSFLLQLLFPPTSSCSFSFRPVSLRNQEQLVLILVVLPLLFEQMLRQEKRN